MLLRTFAENSLKPYSTSSLPRGHAEIGTTRGACVGVGTTSALLTRVLVAQAALGEGGVQLNLTSEPNIASVTLIESGLVDRIYRELALREVHPRSTR